MPEDSTSVHKFFLCREVYPLMSEVYGEAPLPGIYRLHVADESGAFRPLPRVLGVDRGGILYIGTSTNVHARIGLLNRSVFAAYGRPGYRDAAAHQTGKHLVRAPQIMQRFGLDRLCLTVEPASTAPVELEGSKSAHSVLEAKLLAAYRAAFGENPPLNSHCPL